MSSSSQNHSSSSTGGAQQYGPYGPFGPTFALIPGVQQYDWGRAAGEGSLVARMAQATPEANVKQPRASDKFAELWMGTHPTLPSLIIPPVNSPLPSRPTSPSSTYISLSSYLSRHPALLQAAATQEEVGSDRQSLTSYFARPKGELPFLFKVLSVGTALSIQAHPDKQLAVRLHKERPETYRDDNHKPEMAIALTRFRGFCAFRPLKELASFLDSVPEFAQLVDAPAALRQELGRACESGDREASKKAIRGVFERLMKSERTRYSSCVDALVARYKEAQAQGSKVEVSQDLVELVLQLNEQYPSDIGVMCTFVLNVVDLEAGEALFLSANEPHAYIAGDIVECMAASDNVVRAGLTPKLRDTDTLVEMLTYESSTRERQLMKPEVQRGAFGANSLVFDPPIEEFSVVRTQLDAGVQEQHRKVEGPSIFILSQGSGTLVSKPTPMSNGVRPTLQDGLVAPDAERKFALERVGQCFFVGAGTQVELQASSDSSEPMIVFRAFVELPTK